MAVITAPAEVNALRRGGQIAAQALLEVVQAVKPGVDTKTLDTIAARSIRQAGGQPSFLGFQGYPASLCTSINHEVVHGIPSPRRILNTGDVVGLDIGVEYQKLFTDHAVTVGVGKIDHEHQALLSATAEALAVGLQVVRAGARVGDISAAIEQYLKPRYLGIVTQLTGHGVGRAVHEAPAIPNVGRAGTGPILVPGMVLAIEPMVTLGGAAVETLADGWTVITQDHRPAAHFEHTVLVTNDGCEIITRP